MSSAASHSAKRRRQGEDGPFISPLFPLIENDKNPPELISLKEYLGLKASDLQELPTKAQLALPKKLKADGAIR